MNRYGDTNFDKNRQTIVRMVWARLVLAVGYCEYSQWGTVSTGVLSVGVWDAPNVG